MSVERKPALRNYIASWFRPKPYPQPDIERLQRCVDELALASEIAYPSLFGLGPRRYRIGWLHDAQTVADFYARVWFRDGIDAELFALEAAIAEESVPV